MRPHFAKFSAFTFVTLKTILWISCGTEHNFASVAPATSQPVKEETEQTSAAAAAEERPYFRELNNVWQAGKGGDLIIGGKPGAVFVTDDPGSPVVVTIWTIPAAELAKAKDKDGSTTVSGATNHGSFDVDEDGSFRASLPRSKIVDDSYVIISTDEYDESEDGTVFTFEDEEKLPRHAMSLVGAASFSPVQNSAEIAPIMQAFGKTGATESSDGSLDSNPTGSGQSSGASTSGSSFKDETSVKPPLEEGGSTALACTISNNRALFGISITFDEANGGILSVTGDDSGNMIWVSAVNYESEGVILVSDSSDGTDPISIPCVTNITMNGSGGDDTMVYQGSTALGQSMLLGGAGTDTITVTVPGSIGIDGGNEGDSVTIN